MGAIQVHIARTFGCTRLTISRLLERVNQTGRTVDRSQNGRLRVTTPAEDRYIRTLHLRNPFLTVAESAATALDDSITVSRRLHAADIRAFKPFCGMILTCEHRRARVRWARIV